MKLVALLLVVLVAAVAGASVIAAPLRGVTVAARPIEVSRDFLAMRVQDSAGDPIGLFTVGCSGGSSVAVRQCIATLALPKGKIHFNGTITYNAVFSLTVLGGTGIFLGQRGVLAALKGRDGLWTLEVHFQ